MSKPPEEHTVSPQITDEWMIRDCPTYDDEYKECRSIKARLHQYFIHGHAVDCTQWQKDHDNCLKFKNNSNVNAGKELVESEKQRKQSRLKAHNENTVWAKRAQPPADWNQPLPEWMAQQNENTYLAHKAREMREGVADDIMANRSACLLS